MTAVDADGNIVNTPPLEIALVLDHSFSMGSIWKETVGGYEVLVEDQKGNDKPANFTLNVFNTQFRTVIDGVPLKDVPKNLPEGIRPGGGTALLDAVGGTIASLKAKGAEDAVLVIMTDGEENGSRDYSLEQVRTMVEEVQEAGWTVMFLGANIDAFEAGAGLGVARGTTAGYTASGIGTRSVYAASSEALNSRRTRGKVGADWSKGIQ